MTSLLRIFVSHFSRLGTRASRRREDLHRVAIGGAARDFHTSPLRPLASRYSKYPRCVLEVLYLRRKVHGAKFLGGRAFSTLSPSYMGSVILSSGARYQSYVFIVGIPHLSLASSLLSLLLAIVLYTSGSYVVVELSRSLSASPHHLHDTDLISSSERLFCEKNRRMFFGKQRLKRLEVGTESRDRIFSFPLA